MAATTKTWLNNNPPQCEDDDLNGFKEENNNLIQGSGQVLDTGDRQQTHKAVAYYAAGGDYYTDGGAANAYALSVGGSRVAPPGYFAGMRVRFTAANDNTGPSTVNVASLGVKTIKLPYYPAAQLVGGEISGIVELMYDGTDFILIQSDGLANSVKPNWTRGKLLGSGLSISSPGPSALATLGANRVAYIDATNEQLGAYDFDGSTWSLVGSALTITGAGTVALTGLSDTDVAYFDDSLGELRTYRFNGSTWSLVGSGLTVASATRVSLAAVNATDVAFLDDGNAELRMYRFNGSTWSLVGSGLSITGMASFSDLAALSATDVAMCDDGNAELRTYRFNGSTWSLVGSGLGINSPSGQQMAALSATDVVLVDGTNGILKAYRFNGSSWSQVGGNLYALASAASSSSLTTLATNEVALFNVDTGGTDYLEAIEISYGITPLPIARQLTG